MVEHRPRARRRHHALDTDALGQDARVGVTGAHVAPLPARPTKDGPRLATSQAARIATDIYRYRGDFASLVGLPQVKQRAAKWMKRCCVNGSCETAHRGLNLKLTHVFGPERPVRTPFMHPQHETIKP
jgi:hypothetical protein